MVVKHSKSRFVLVNAFLDLFLNFALNINVSMQDQSFRYAFSMLNVKYISLKMWEASVSRIVRIPFRAEPVGLCKVIT